MNNLEKNFEKSINFEKKLKDLELHLSKEIEGIQTRLDNFLKTQNELVEQNKYINEKMVSINDDFKNLDKKLNKKFLEINDKIQVQDEISTERIDQYNKEFVNYKNTYTSKIDEIIRQQDVFKISYTINENKLLEKVKDVIIEEINQLLKDKEKEILMDLWIKELKKIISDFDKIKKLNPKEFILQIDEISNVIDIFKQKLS
ncbi:MAG: hypothetical protein JXA99_10605 [Candidatus Lokiarchaeota archaeon]|nr:hypothetical protein [Candidatus Lokiarchaeota archaeon]